MKRPRQTDRGRGGGGEVEEHTYDMVHLQLPGSKDDDDYLPMDLQLPGRDADGVYETVDLQLAT